MGGCCYRTEKGEYQSIAEKKQKYTEGGIKVYDLSGISGGGSLKDLARIFLDFKPSSLQMIKRHSRHSAIRLATKREIDGVKVNVNIKFSSKLLMRIEINLDYEESENEDVSDIECISFFAKERKESRSLGEFFLWIEEHKANLDNLLEEEKNMGKVIYSFFNEKETASNTE